MLPRLLRRLKFIFSICLLYWNGHLVGIWAIYRSMLGQKVKRMFTEYRSLSSVLKCKIMKRRILFYFACLERKKHWNFEQKQFSDDHFWRKKKFHNFWLTILKWFRRIKSIFPQSFIKTCFSLSFRIQFEILL